MEAECLKDKAGGGWAQQRRKMMGGHASHLARKRQAEQGGIVRSGSAFALFDSLPGLLMDFPIGRHSN